MVGDDIELPAQCPVAQRPDADGALSRCRTGDPGESNTEIKGSEGQEIEPLTGCNPPGTSVSIDDDAADRFTRPHQIETLIDVRKRELMGDQIVDVDLLLHVPIDDPRHIGASLGAAEGGSLPHPAGNQLERAGGNFLTRARDADDDADPPPAVAAFERLAHGPDIADALEAVIGAALGQVDEIGDEIALDFGRVDKVSKPELSGERLPSRVEVNPDDHVGADHAAALDDIEPDPAETEDDNIGPGLDLGRGDHRADAG